MRGPGGEFGFAVSRNHSSADAPRLAGHVEAASASCPSPNRPPADRPGGWPRGDLVGEVDVEAQVHQALAERLDHEAAPAHDR
jgi:hypothetical protein